MQFIHTAIVEVKTMGERMQTKHRMVIAAMGGVLLSAIAFQAVSNLTSQAVEAEAPVQPYPCASRGPRWGARRRGMGGMMGHRFDRQSIKTVQGKVMSLDAVVSPRQGFSRGRHLLMKSGDDTIAVHLGPRGYIDAQNFPLAANDDIVVTGSLFEVSGKPTMIVQTIQNGSRTLTLRDQNGIPNWRHGDRQGCW